MSNMRVVYDNAADRATLSASTTAGGLVATNLQTDTKSEVWRSTSTSATITVTWASGEIVGVVAIPFCSLTSAATIRVRCYTAASDPSPAVDTGTILACPSSPFEDFDWGLSPLGVNAYSYGGGAYGVAWFAQGSYEKLVVDLVDTTNPLGYIEASRLVVGRYWSPVNNAQYGAEVAVVDTSKNERSDAGDLKTDRGTMHKVLSLDLEYMPSSDRNTLWNILRGSGSHSPIYLSLSPEATDSIEEQMFQIYGKLSGTGKINYRFVNQFSSQVEIEEV